jgi:hypothetical protein
MSSGVRRCNARCYYQAPSKTGASGDRSVAVLRMAATSASHPKWGLESARFMDAAISALQRKLEWSNVGSEAGCTLFLGDFISCNCGGILQHAAGIVCNAGSGAILRMYSSGIRRCATSGSSLAIVPEFTASGPPIEMHRSPLLQCATFKEYLPLLCMRYPKQQFASLVSTALTCTCLLRRPKSSF